jgi:hypothetical protein
MLVAREELKIIHLLKRIRVALPAWVSKAAAHDAAIQASGLQVAKLALYIF